MQTTTPSKLAIDPADWRIINATGLMSNPAEFDAHLGLLFSEFQDGVHSGSPVGKWWSVQHAGALCFVRAGTGGVRALGTIIVAQVEVVHRGFIIRPKTDFGSTPYFIDGRNVWHGWNVIDQNGCNALPGATWGKTISEAKRLADCLILAGGTPEKGDASFNVRQSEKFWKLVEASA